MPKRSTHKRSAHLRLHTRRRAEERYGITLTKDKMSGLIKLLQNPDCYKEKGKVVLVQKQSNNRSLCFVWSGEDKIWMLVAYDRKRKEIATILPTEGDGLLHPARPVPTYQP